MRFALVIVTLLVPQVASAQGMETIDAGALVTKVDGQRVTIGRGSKTGLKVGDAGGLFTLLPRQDASVPTIELDVRLSVGRVAEVADSSAVLTTEAVIVAPSVGDYFPYTMTVSSDVVSPLLRVVALGIELTSQRDDKPFVTLEALLADRKSTTADKAIDAMIADIRSLRAVAIDAFEERPTSGPYRSKSVAAIIDGLDRAQITTFLVYLDAYAAQYRGQRWKVPDALLAWVYMGAPSGDDKAMVRKMQPQLVKARDAFRAGNLEAARAIYAGILKTWTAGKEPAEGIKRIDRALMLRRAVAADGDDTASAYALVEELYLLGVLEAALEQVAPLQKRGFDPVKLGRIHGEILVDLGRWPAARDVFDVLAKQRPTDAAIASLAKLARAQAKLAAAPSDVPALLEVGAVLVERERWDEALVVFRKVLDTKGIPGKQFGAAARGQMSVWAGKQLDVMIRWTTQHIVEHEAHHARTKLATVLKLLDQLGDKTRDATVLDELSATALDVYETDLAVELARKRIERAPDQRGYESLALWLAFTNRLDEAEAIGKQALTKGDTAVAHLVLAQVALVRGKLGDAEKSAKKAADQDRKYAWPRVVLARVEAARGQWDEAHVLASKALELMSDGDQIRATVTATARGLQAHEALRADSKSARERLRLVRALADLGLVARAKQEIVKLPKTGTWRGDAWWAIAVSTDRNLPASERLAAAREAKPTMPRRKRTLAILDAEVQLRARPADDTIRVALAKLHLADSSENRALATLGPLLARETVPAAAATIAGDAREALPLRDQIDLAWSAIHRFELDAALRIMLEVRHARDRIGAPDGRIAARTVQAEVLYQQNKHADAIKVLEEAHAIARADGNDVQVAFYERKIGEYRAATGSSDDYAAALERERKLCADVDDENCLHFAHGHLSSLEQTEGRLASSIDHARLAWNYADRLGLAQNARLARFRFAVGALNANRIGDGEEVALALLADARTAGDLTVEQGSLLLLGAVAMLRGDGPKARSWFQSVYDFGTRNGQPIPRAIAKLFEGQVWLDVDHQPAKAVGVLEAATALYAQLGGGGHTDRGIALRRLAEARLETGDIAGARKTAGEGVALAQKFGRNLELAQAQQVLALIAIADTKPDDAIKHAKAAVAIAEKTDTVTVLWNAYFVLGRAQQLKNDDKEALAAYELSLQHLGNALLAAGTDSERSGYSTIGRVRDVYRNTIDLLLKVGNTTRAREVLELSRDAMLKQAFQGAQVASADVATKAVLDSYTGARDRVRALQQQLDKAAETRNAQAVKTLADRVAKARADLGEAAAKLKVSDRQLFQALTMAPQEIAARAPSLPKGTVVVEYFATKDALSIFVHSAANKNPAVVRVKVTALDLAKAVDAFRDAISAEAGKIRQRDQVEALGRKLDDWLLEPIRSHLKDATTIVIVPFGPLYYVPFDALVVSEPSKPVRYAVEDYRIAMQTTWTLEALMRPVRARSTGRMLAIANPDGTLPGAAREVALIKKTAVPDAQVLGKTATHKKVLELAGTSRYLHIATHGILDDDPRKTYLKLADVPLTVNDIAGLQGMRTNTDLVVLSACETATDLRDAAGDDLVSLASGFALAGAPSVVASLWSVSDDSTAELMAAFYRALEKTKTDRLDALRTAKLNILRLEKDKARPFSAPYHWASFQLYGDFRAPATASK